MQKFFRVQEISSDYAQKNQEVKDNQVYDAQPLLLRQLSFKLLTWPRQKNIWLISNKLVVYSDFTGNKVVSAIDEYILVNSDIVLVVYAEEFVEVS